MCQNGSAGVFERHKGVKCILEFGIAQQWCLYIIKQREVLSKGKPTLNIFMPKCLHQPKPL